MAQYSIGSDAAELDPRLARLRESGWTLDEEGKGIKKRFYFQNWTRCLNFVKCLEIMGQRHDHHARLSITRHTADAFWTTYDHSDPRGEARSVSIKDLDSAERCDTAADHVRASENVPIQDDRGQCLQEQNDGNNTVPEGWHSAFSGIRTTFTFSTYTKCCDFVQIVGIRCKEANHHPEITFFPTWVQVTWPGLSDKDVRLAQICVTEAQHLKGTIAARRDAARI